MSPFKFIGILTTLALCLASLGCFGGGGDGGSRGRFGLLKKKKNADVASRDKRRGVKDVDEYSPEASMQRDLKRLQETEKAQAKLVKDMRSSLNQGSDQVMREEEKLREIRTRMASYDAALRRYDGGHARGSGSPAARPAERLEGDVPRNVRTAYAPRENAGRAPRGRTRSSRRPEARPPVVREGETLVFDPNAPENNVPMDTYAMAAPTPPAARPAQAGDGQPAPQHGYMPTAFERQDDGWVAPSSLFSKRSEGTPNYPPADFYAKRAQRNREAAVLNDLPAASDIPLYSDKGTHAPMRSAPASQSMPPVAPLPPPPSTFIPPQAAASGGGTSGASSPLLLPPPGAAAPAVVPESAPFGFGGDEVFTPDLYLGGS